MPAILIVISLVSGSGLFFYEKGKDATTKQALKEKRICLNTKQYEERCYRLSPKDSYTKDKESL